MKLIGLFTELSLVSLPEEGEDTDAGTLVVRRCRGSVPLFFKFTLLCKSWAMHFVSLGFSSSCGAPFLALFTVTRKVFVELLSDI